METLSKQGGANVAERRYLCAMPTLVVDMLCDSQRARWLAACVGRERESGTLERTAAPLGLARDRARLRTKG